MSAQRTRPDDISAPTCLHHLLVRDQAHLVPHERWHAHVERNDDAARPHKVFVVQRPLLQPAQKLTGKKGQAAAQFFSSSVLQFFSS